MDHKISERYGFYLVKIILPAKDYYTVFSLKSLTGDDDTYLSDENHVLLFSSIKGLKDYIYCPMYSLPFDSTEIKNWINNFQNIQPYATFNLGIKNLIPEMFSLKEDMVNNKYISFLKEILGIIGLAQDLKFQFTNLKIEKILNSAELQSLQESLYDMHVWSTDSKDDLEKTTDKFNNEKIIVLLKKLIEEIEASFKLFTLAG